MKNRLYLVAALLAVLALSIGTATAYDTGKDKLDLTGDWYLVVFNSNRQYLLSSLNTDIRGNPTYALEQHGNKLICIGKGKFGNLKIQGTVTGNDIEMTGTAGEIPARFEGKFEEGRINGKIHLGLEEADFMMKRK